MILRNIPKDIFIAIFCMAQHVLTREVFYK